MKTAHIITLLVVATAACAHFGAAEWVVEDKQTVLEFHCDSPGDSEVVMESVVVGRMAATNASVAGALEAAGVHANIVETTQLSAATAQLEQAHVNELSLGGGKQWRVLVSSDDDALQFVSGNPLMPNVTVDATGVHIDGDNANVFVNGDKMSAGGQASSGIVEILGAQTFTPFEWNAVATTLCADAAGTYTVDMSMQWRWAGYGNNNNVSQIVVSEQNHAACVLVDGRVRCFGSTQYCGYNIDIFGNYLGVGSLPSSVPFFHFGDEYAVNLAAYGRSWCVAFATGRAKCWGVDYVTNADAGASEYGNQTVYLADEDWKSFAASDYGGICGLKLSGTLHCWGGNTYTEGYGGSTKYTTPGPSLLSSVNSICGDSNGFCALSYSGSVYCWGSGKYEGRGDSVETYTPQLVSIGSPVKQISCGNYHVCALTTTNATYCWGRNHEGQLGLEFGGESNTEMTPQQTGPVLLQPVLGAYARAVSVGRSNTCVLYSNAKVKCWGEQTAEISIGYSKRILTGNTDIDDIGDDVGEISSLPFLDFNDRAIAAVWNDERQICVTLKDTLDLVCWGNNLHGALGYGADDDAYLNGKDLAFHLSEPIPQTMYDGQTKMDIHVMVNGEFRVHDSRSYDLKHSQFVLVQELEAAQCIDVSVKVYVQ